LCCSTLSLYKEAVDLGIFHIVSHTHKLAPKEVYNILTRTGGFKLQHMPYDDWVEKLLNDSICKADNPLYALRPMFSSGFPGTNAGKWRCDNVKKLVHESLKFIEVDQLVILKSIQWLKENKTLLLQ